MKFSTLLPKILAKGLAGRAFLLLAFYALTPGESTFAQNVFSGEPVQWAGRPNGYSTTPYNSDYRTLGYRKVSTTTGNPSDGRGQWSTTISVQASGGNITPDNMPGGGGAGWLLISGPSGNRFQNKWNFNGVGQAALNAINGVVLQGGGQDMGLDMGTAGYYTFNMRDAGYTNTEFYVGYTFSAPVTVSRSGQAFDPLTNAGIISISTGATPSAGENIYVRYRASTNDFTTATSVVQASGAGTSWSASIPAQACGTVVYYYVYSSTRSLSQIGTDPESNRALGAIRYDDNAGANYSYTVSTTVITASSGANGTVTPAGTSVVNCGDNATYTITADPGYSISDVIVDGGSAGAVGSYTFTNVTAGHTISAVFSAPNNYNITSGAGANGTISPDGATNVTEGGNQSYTITANTCYNIADVLVDGISVGAVGTYTFSNVTANHSISASFSAVIPVNAGTVTGASPLCIGATASYSSNGDAGGTWSSSNESVAVVGLNTGVVTGVGQGTANIIYTINAGCGSPASASQPVTVQAIDYANLQFPASGTICTGGGLTAYGQVYEGGVTEAGGQGAGITVEIGYSNSNTDPATWANWSAATFNVQSGNNDEYQATIGNAFAPGTYYYTFRYSLNGCAFQYGGYSAGGGNFWDGINNVSGVLTVSPNYDITATSGANGSVTPTGTTTLCSGSNQTYTITPDACYHVLDVLVDGVSVGAVTSYTFSNVTASHSINASFAINAALTVSVSGPVNVCAYIGSGDQVTYTATSAGAAAFSWVTPPNVTVVSGAGTANLTVTFQNGFLPQANKQIRVTALSLCGSSNQVIYYLVAQAPGTPAPIVASSSNVCAVIGTAGTITYTIPSVPGAGSYIWTSQAGTTNLFHTNGPGVNDTTVTVSFTNAFSTSTITVSATNSNCGAGGTRSITVSRVSPSTPGLISGPTNTCPYIAPGGTPASYSVVPVAGATSYTWTIPAGATGFTGQGTNAISFTYPNGFTNGTVSVTATNGCGTSAARFLTVTRLNPSAPSAIDVIQTQPCPDRVFTYTVAGLPANATSVEWTVPPGAILVSGQGAASITVSYPPTAVNGTVTATAVSNCGNSTTRVSNVHLPACPPVGPRSIAKGESATVAETMTVNVYPNPAVADFKLQVLTAGKDQIHVRVLDAQGRACKEFVVLPYQATTIGSDLKAGAYMMEVRQGNHVKTVKLLKF